MGCKSLLNCIGAAVLAGAFSFSCVNAKRNVAVIPDGANTPYMSDNEARRFAKEHFKERKLINFSYEDWKLLDSFKENPEALQNWVNEQTYYMKDLEQFGSGVWAPAAYFIKTGREDCDGILAISHYSLRHPKNRGIALWGWKIKNGKKTGYGHAVYLYYENGFYGIRSKAESEAKKAKYASIDEAVNDVFKARFDYYQELELPRNYSGLLYGFNLDELAKRGQEKKLKLVKQIK